MPVFQVSNAQLEDLRSILDRVEHFTDNQARNLLGAEGFAMDGLRLRDSAHEMWNFLSFGLDRQTIIV